jgi:hypothetical protein
VNSGRCVPALLILYSTAIIWEDVGGGCPLKGVGYYMKNCFVSELFFDKLASLKLQQISYEDPLLHKLLNALFFTEIRPETAELFSVLYILRFHIKNGLSSELFLVNWRASSNN